MTTDTTVTTPNPSAPAAAAAPVAPIVQATTPAPESVTPPPAAPVETAKAPVSAPAAETPKAPEAAIELAKTILGEEAAKSDAPKSDKAPETKAETPKTEPAKEPAKTEEAKKDATVEANKAPEQTKEEGVKSDEPAPTPTYQAFKLPEGIQADEKGLGEFTSLLAEIELAKGDHTKMQDYGQKLVDRHIAEVQTNLKRQSEYFVSLFEKQKTEWKEKFMSDPEIGGNRWETSANAAREFIRTHGGNETQQKELRELMQLTGVGNHPAMIRVFAKAMTVMKEGSPLPAAKPETRPLSKIEKRYGKTTT